MPCPLTPMARLMLRVRAPALFVVGNKADKDAGRAVPDAEAAAFAQNAGAQHLLVSARDMLGPCATAAATRARGSRRACMCVCMCAGVAVLGLDELFVAVGHALVQRKRAAGVPVPTGGFALTDGPDVRAEARTPPPTASASSCC
jgi:hypothetical protein